jgi:hypothetical protein
MRVESVVVRGAGNSQGERFTKQSKDASKLLGTLWTVLALLSVAGRHPDVEDNSRVEGFALPSSGLTDVPPPAGVDK